MFNSEVLEVGIGIVFVFILVSIICTAVREGIEAILKTRAAYLEFGIRELLHDKNAEGLAKSFFEHPLIYSLFPGDPPDRPKSSKRPGILASGANLPSYIPAKNFAIALMDMAVRGQRNDGLSSGPAAPAISPEAIRENILNLSNAPVQRVLLNAVDSANGDLAKVQANIEAWFDSGMDRVSGWYKRSTQWILFAIAVVVAVGLNIDTIRIAEYLHRNDAVRVAMVAQAEKVAKDPNLVNGADSSEAAKNALASLNSFSLPIGWTKQPNDDSESLKWPLVSVALGWLITALAGTLGAPFWFDVLNKFVVIRSTVKPHEKSPEEASEDRQVKPAQTATLPQPQPPAEGGQAPEPAAAQPPADQDSGDIESDTDGCDVEITEETPDEELPPAEGGVEK